MLARLDSSLADGWSLPPTRPDYVLSCSADTLRTTLHHHGRLVRTWDDPLEALRWMTEAFDAPSQRWVGYLGYDLGGLFEDLPRVARDDLRLPLFAWMRVSDTQATAEVEQAPAMNSRIIESTFSRADYERAVARAIEYIAAGDIFQVNLSQRLSVRTSANSASVYQRLLEQSPAVYGALLDYDDFALVCNSPELFLRVTPDRKVITRPIKGTRPRLPGMQEELLASVKDQAELNMIVDLERNDLGRVCRIGSVRVTEPRTIEAHPTVYHGVATIEGLLNPGVGLVELLSATFPGGSITGAPKIRAIQIIDELEPVRRGAYCGAIGQVRSDGSIELNIAIRTMTLMRGMAYVSVGGGIVADSIPAQEYDETMVKARAMLAALGVE